MCIRENTGYNAVALQCENVLPKKQVIDELEERFGLCLIFYDNDYDKEENWGQIFSKRLEQETGFIGRCIDSKHEAKDFSDLVEKVGVKKAVEIFEREILMPF
jgi:DTW domain-containing protein YfiP